MTLDNCTRVIMPSFREGEDISAKEGDRFGSLRSNGLRLTRKNSFPRYEECKKIFEEKKKLRFILIIIL